MKKNISLLPFLALALLSAVSFYFDSGIFVGMVFATAPLAVPGDVVEGLKKILNNTTEPPATETKTSGFTDEQLEGINKIIEAKTKSVKAGFGAAVIESVGDPESVTKAFAGYLKGSVSADKYKGILEETKASNNTDMNIGTPADGGYVVPTGHYNGIVAKKNESSLAQALGVMQIPGIGTTVNVPIETGSANVFISTAEAAAYDRDAPVLGQKPMTLTKYTKKILISEELIQDEDSRLFAFLNDYVGRAIALTENGLLIAKVLADGTALSTTASTTVVTAPEIKALPYAIADGYDDSNFKWVMRRATEGVLRTMQGNVFLFDETPDSTAKQRTLGSYPVYHASAVEAYGATGKKFAAFGDFSCVGQRSAPQINVLRDPYSNSGTGQITLLYTIRTVFEVLNPAGIGYIKHA